MLILLLIYFAVVLWGAKPHLKQSNSQYISIENTTAIKGIFILMVFYSHFNSYIALTDSIYDTVYIKFFRFIGQAMVALFMFYSGFGVMESITRKGTDYVLKMPKNRIFKTLINFDFAVLLFLVLRVVFKQTTTLKQFALSLVGWDSLGNSNWYIFVILLLYLLTFLVFAVIRKQTEFARFSAVFVFTGTLLAIIGLTYYFNIKPGYWYDTALCYALGMGYSLVRKTAEKIINKNLFTWGLFLVLSGAAYTILKGHHIFIECIANVFFAIFVVILTMRITLKNKILTWCGDHLFEIYILQRIPMIIFQNIGLARFNTYLYFAVCVVTTIVLSLAFRFLTNKLWKYTKLFS